MTNPWAMAILGGVLIGSSISVLLLFNGKIAGIGGITSRLLRPVRGDILWRVMFLAGLVMGGIIMAVIEPRLFNLEGLQRSEIIILVSGVIMGFGGRMANGCTSGHGICGSCQLSKRSIVATCVFFGTALFTMFVISRFFGGAL